MTARAQALAARDAEIEASTQRALAAPPRRMSAMESMSTRLGVSEQELTAALTKTVFAGCRSQAEFLALIVVANEYRLNPLTKEIYAFPAKGGGVVPMVSVDGWITLMNSHPMFDGIEFEYHNDEKGQTVAIESIIHRKDRNKPIKVIEYMDECKRGTDPWKNSPRRMLRHRALIQGARIAFGFSGIYAQGDDDYGVINAEFSVVSEGAGPMVLPSDAQLREAAGQQGVREEQHDPETGEVARRDASGLTEVDEETARALDAGNDGMHLEENPAAAEGPADEQRGEAPAEEEQPLWKTAHALVEGLINAAKDKKSWERAEAEFLKISAGLPDEAAKDLDAKLSAKRAALQTAA